MFSREKKWTIWYFVLRNDHVESYGMKRIVYTQSSLADKFYQFLPENTKFFL